MTKRSKDVMMWEVDRYAPRHVNEVLLHAIMREWPNSNRGGYVATVRKNDHILNEFRQGIYQGQQTVQSVRHPVLFRVLRRGSIHDKTQVAVFTATSDNPALKNLSFIEDALKQYRQKITEHESFKCDHLIIPIAENQFFFPWPLNFWHRDHFVTLHVEPNATPPKATVYDSKGMLSQYYSLAGVRKALQEVFPLIEMSVVYRGDQPLLDGKDCGPWCVTYGLELVIQGQLKAGLEVDRDALQAAYDVYTGKANLEMERLALLMQKNKETVSTESNRCSSFNEQKDDQDVLPASRIQRLLNFFSRHKGLAAWLAVGAVIVLAAALMALIYFTAPVSLPVIAVVAVKLGVSLAAMQAVPALGMAAIVGSVGSVLLAGVVAATIGAVHGLKKWWQCCFHRQMSTSSSPVNEEREPDRVVGRAGLVSSTAKLSNGLGFVKDPANPKQTKVINDEENSERDLDLDRDLAEFYDIGSVLSPKGFST